MGTGSAMCRNAMAWDTVGHVCLLQTARPWCATPRAIAPVGGAPWCTSRLKMPSGARTQRSWAIHHKPIQAAREGHFWPTYGQFTFRNRGF